MNTDMSIEDKRLYKVVCHTFFAPDHDIYLDLNRKDASDIAERLNLNADAYTSYHVVEMETKETAIHKLLNQYYSDDRIAMYHEVMKTILLHQKIKNGVIYHDRTKPPIFEYDEQSQRLQDFVRDEIKKYMDKYYKSLLGDE